MIWRTSEVEIEGKKFCVLGNSRVPASLVLRFGIEVSVLGFLGVHSTEAFPWGFATLRLSLEAFP